MAHSGNKYTNDGSFLEQFRKLQEQKEAEKSKGKDPDPLASVKNLVKPVTGRMGGQKRKLPLKQSAKVVHKAFRDDSDSEEDERVTFKEGAGVRGPSKSQSEGQPLL